MFQVAILKDTYITLELTLKQFHWSVIYISYHLLNMTTLYILMGPIFNFFSPFFFFPFDFPFCGLRSPVPWVQSKHFHHGCTEERIGLE